MGPAGTTVAEQSSETEAARTAASGGEEPKNDRWTRVVDSLIDMGTLQKGPETLVIIGDQLYHQGNTIKVDKVELRIKEINSRILVLTGGGCDYVVEIKK
jgi:hypothetical protein